MNYIEKGFNMSLANAGRKAVQKGLSSLGSKVAPSASKVVSAPLFPSSRNFATKATIGASFSADAAKSTYKADLKVSNLSSKGAENVAKIAAGTVVTTFGIVTLGQVANEKIKHSEKVAELESEVKYLKHEAEITKDFQKQIQQKELEIAGLKSRTFSDFVWGRKA